MAGASWLSHRCLYTALLWAIQSQRRAWETTNEVRQRRGELRRALDSLQITDNLLERTNRELETSRKEAEEARQAKSRFVANISHEFRTPLNVIVGFAEMVCTAPESYGAMVWPRELREDLLTIWRNAEHLLKMVDDVLDLAQLQAYRLPILPEPTDLAEFIKDALGVGSAILRNSNLLLRLNLPEGLPVMQFDQTRIRQVLLNLLSNAVRHTHQGYIEVGALRAAQEVVVYVRDSGEGIPAEKLSSLFQEFEHIDTSKHQPHQGAGLGLSIAKHLLHLHGGRIWVESEVHKGSTFFFSLPLPSAHATAQPSALRTIEGRDLRPVQPAAPIVVLSDDPLAVRTLGRHLERRLVVAASVSEAVERIREEHPDIAYVAMRKGAEPDTGLTQARNVLEAVYPSDVPVLASEFPTERRSGDRLGAEGFLVKPVTRAELVSAVMRVCSRPQRVIIAEDEADMRLLLKRILQAEWPDLQIAEAGSGTEVLTLARQGCSLILLDLLMPDMQGVEVMAVLRSSPVTAEIPIVVVTARGPEDDPEMLRRGELHVLKSKAFSAEEIMRTVEAVSKALPPRYVASSLAERPHSRPPHEL